MLAINKPAGWSSAHADESDTMLEIAKSYIKEKYRKPGNVFLGVVHRIDKPTSGVLLFARTSKAAARLSEQFRKGGVEKVYWAVIDRKPSRGHGWALGDSGTLEDHLWHDDDSHDVKVVTDSTLGAKAAKLFYTVKALHETQTLLDLRPQTGRKHQLRVQLASRECPIVGDRKYGSIHSFGNAIALHARSLTILHPITTEPLTFTAELPRMWRGRFAQLLRTVK